MTTGAVTRAEVQGKRIRLAGENCDMSMRRLHGELVTRGEKMGVYETFRKQTRGKGQDLSYAVLLAISEITEAPLDWIAGNDGAEFPELHMGVSLSSDQLVAA